MPEWLFEEVKDEIPKFVGVTTGDRVLKKAKNVPLELPEKELYINLVCALNREANKYYTNLDKDKLSKYKSAINKYMKKYENESNEMKHWKREYYKLRQQVEGNYEEIFNCNIIK
ncbi:hypothetical protein KQI61_05680 [Anaerocolumna aminovalerica]|uniref:hypothetical protein n=1 Tax=Anaerocolumna aminovalerica TaxID=1527 RepID=UPI001C0EFDC7|nr:hypothetical protein [Anaerocolumna aminovalerica]MBU5331680.1 hypothetical protein [Anaerocolumna aminovalerica]